MKEERDSCRGSQGYRGIGKDPKEQMGLLLMTCHETKKALHGGEGEPEEGKE